MDNFVAKKSEIENERRNLIESLEKEKKDKLRELADKDREKVQATGTPVSKSRCRYAQEGHASSHPGDQDFTSRPQEGVAGNHYSSHRPPKPSIDDRARVPVEVDWEVAIQELQTPGVGD